MKWRVDSWGGTENLLFSVVKCCDLYMFSSIAKLHNTLASISAIVRLCLKIFVVMLAVPFLNTISS